MKRKHLYIVIIFSIAAVATIINFYVLPKYQEHKKKIEVAEFFDVAPNSIEAGSTEEFFSESAPTS